MENKWPHYNDQMINAVVDVLKSGKVNQWTGTKVKEFEQKFSNYINCKYSVAVFNGTVALELCLKTLKLKEGDEPLSTADSMSAAKDVLHRMVEHHQLCQSKCDLHQMPGPCFHFHLHKCKGACTGSEAPELYNERSIEAIKRYSFHLESFFIVGKGRAVEERSIICIEKGQYKGFGYTDISISEPEPTQLREQIKSYPHNRDIQQILCTYLKRNHKKLSYDV